MRPKVVIAALLLALAVLALAFLPKFFGAKKQTASPSSEPAVTATNSPKKPAAAVAAKTTAVAPASPVLAAPVPAPDQSQKIEQLQSLAMNNDADSLKAILAELTDPDPQIRAAARDAAVQFGDPSAAPPLRTVAANAADPEEKKALLEAADYLELPPLGVNSATNPHPSKLLHRAQ